MVLGTTEIRSTNQQQDIQLQYPENNQRYSSWAPSIANAINRVAIPIVVIAGLSLLPGADAGPLEYSACVTGCALFMTPVAVPGCITACLPLLFLPTP